MKILKWEWRSALKTVGIVLIETAEGLQSARIGPTPPGETPFFLNSEKEDALWIAENGAKLSFTEAKAFFPEIKVENYKK